MAVSANSFRLFFIVVASALSAGCAVLDPYVEGDRSKYNETPNLQHALDYAQSTRAAYRKAIRTHSRLNVSSGLIVAGTATAAAVAALSGVSNETLMRIGIGGASVYAVNGFLYSSARQQIYSAGARSITCGVAVFEPLRPVAFDPLKINIGGLQKELPVLQTAVTDARSKLSVAQVPDQLVQAENILAAAKVTLQRGLTVLQAPARLTTFVDGVNDEITAALQKTEPDVSALVNSLGTAIPSNAGLIAGQPAPAAPGVKAALEKGPLKTAVVYASNQAAKVKQYADTVEMLLAGVATPQAESLAACREFLQTGPFRVFPQPSVIVDTARAEPSADIVASGGTPPHTAVWLGQTPPPGVSLTETAGPAGTTIQVKAPTGIRGPYQLLVQDKGGNSAALLVSFEGGTAGAPAAVGTPAVTGISLPAAAPQRDPRVVQVQTDLIALGCLAETDENGNSNRDGIWGTVTTSAYNAFAEVALGGVDAAEATIGKLGEAGFYDKLGEQLSLAKEAGRVRCGDAG